MARGVEEGDLALFAFKGDGNLICTDTLGNAASLAFDDVASTDGV